MPGAEYSGDQPDSFMPRDQVAALLEGYPERFRLPVCYNTPVVSNPVRVGLVSVFHMISSTKEREKPRISRITRIKKAPDRDIRVIGVIRDFLPYLSFFLLRVLRG